MGESRASHSRADRLRPSLCAEAPRLVLQGHNGYSSYAGNAALENGLAYNNALANGVHSTPLGTLPLFGQGAASSPLLAA